MEKIDFFEFVFLWFRIYGRDLPKHQRKMCRWMENIFVSDQKKDALLMAFRNSGKSTVVGLFCKTLSGIGDSKAQAILAYREEHGGFSSIEEIMQVPGIKESTFSKIKDKIAVK